MEVGEKMLSHLSVSCIVALRTDESMLHNGIFDYCQALEQENALKDQQVGEIDTNDREAIHPDIVQLLKVAGHIIDKKYSNT